jgi:hypothetical protein
VEISNSAVLLVHTSWIYKCIFESNPRLLVTPICDNIFGTLVYITLYSLPRALKYAIYSEGDRQSEIERKWGTANGSDFVAETKGQSLSLHNIQTQFHHPILKTGYIFLRSTSMLSFCLFLGTPSVWLVRDFLTNHLYTFLSPLQSATRQVDAASCFHYPPPQPSRKKKVDKLFTLWSSWVCNTNFSLASSFLDCINPVACSPQANYIDRDTVACRRS